MSAYVIIETKLLNPTMYTKYIKKVVPIVKKYGGRYLARGGQIIPMSGDWHPERIILIEFESLERARTWLASPEYEDIAPLRTSSTASRAIMIEGCSEP